jgi:hypothetical protein
VSPLLLGSAFKFGVRANILEFAEDEDLVDVIGSNDFGSFGKVR